MTKYTDCFVDVLTLDDQRRHEADHVLACRHEQQPCLLCSVFDGRRAAIHPHATHQPTATQLQDMWIILAHFLKALVEVSADLPYMLEEGRLAQLAQDGQRDRADQRPTGEGRAVVARMEMLGDGVRRQDRTDRQPTAERFGDHHDIRLDTAWLVRPERAGAAKPALNLVEDEQGMVLVTTLSQRLQELIRCGRDAALALDWLDNHRTHVATDRRFGTP